MKKVNCPLKFAKKTLLLFTNVSLQVYKGYPVSKLVTFLNKNSSLTFSTHAAAEGKQRIGIIGAVRDLHHRDEGQVPGGEAPSKVVGDKDPRSVASGHFSRQDHLQAAGRDEKKGSSQKTHIAFPDEDVTYFPRVPDRDAKL